MIALRSGTLPCSSAAISAILSEDPWRRGHLTTSDGIMGEWMTFWRQRSFAVKME
jgi:hypothetical protein